MTSSPIRHRRLILTYSVATAAVAATSLWPSALRAQAWALFRAPRDMGEVSELLGKRFPDVPSTSTAALAALLEAGTPLILIDTRTSEEFGLSHLPAARHAENIDGALRLVAGMPSDTRIVTYCSIGYRSASVARALLRAGYRNTTNLDGSIFRWANENRPLAGPAAASGLVHPFDESWGRLLTPARRAPLTR